MMRSFKDPEAEKIFHRERTRKLPSNIQQVALRKLRMLNRAETLHDLRVPPGNQLEKLSGDRAGQWSIRTSTINGESALCGLSTMRTRSKLWIITEKKR